MIKSFSTMSRPYDSPNRSFNYKRSSHDSPFRTPFLSPPQSANGNADFNHSSPMNKPFGWKSNNRRFYKGYNDHANKFYSPRRGGGSNFRGGFNRNSPRNETPDISLYVNHSMLHDPWKELSEQLDERTKSIVNRQSMGSSKSANSTPVKSENTSVNETISNSDVTEVLTEESLVLSDASAESPDQRGHGQLVTTDTSSVQ